MASRVRKTKNGGHIISWFAPKRAQQKKPSAISLPKHKRCKCGASGKLKRTQTCHPSGIAGYYICTRGHMFRVMRDRVSRVVRADKHRVYLA